MDKPEARLSHWCIELLDRIVVTDQPSWWTAVDHSVKMTNQTPQAKMNHENHRKYMGIRPHHLDVYIYQYPLFSQIELKFANTQSAAEKALTVGQRDRMTALAGRGVPTGYAWSIPSFYEALRRIGYRLHATAESIVREIEARYAAAQDMAVIKREEASTGKVSRKRFRPTARSELRYTWKAGAS